MGRALLTSLILTSLASAATGFKPFFNRITSESYIDPYREMSRSGHNVEAELIALIEGARRRVWVAAFELRLPRVAQALKAAKERGVDVRLVTENINNYDFTQLDAIIEESSEYEIGRLKDYFAYTDLNKNNSLEVDEIAQMDAIKTIRDAGIPIVDDTADGSKGSGLMHHKFMVIDSKYVFGGSGNFTWSDFHGDKLKAESRGNANNFFTIESQVINKAFADEFSVMWGDGPEGLLNSRFGVKKPYRAPITTQLRDGAKITLQFGATSNTYGWDSSPNGLIGKHISQIETSLEAAFFVWSEQKLANLIPQHLANNVQILVDPFYGYRFYSELLDLLGVQMYSDTCKIEENNAPWKTPASSSGVTYLTRGDLLHHKFAVLDSKKVITGSHNWSANANKNNDEAILVVESPEVATAYQEEFKRLKQSSAIGLSSKLLNKIQEAEANCKPQ